MLCIEWPIVYILSILFNLKCYALGFVIVFELFEDSFDFNGIQKIKKLQNDIANLQIKSEQLRLWNVIFLLINILATKYQNRVSDKAVTT